MLIYIVIEGTLRNKVIEKEIRSESELVSTICFIRDHGLFESDRWIPPYRIKEIKFDQPAGKKMSRMFLEPKDIDDSLLQENNP